MQTKKQYKIQEYTCPKCTTETNGFRINVIHSDESKQHTCTFCGTECTWVQELSADRQLKEHL